MDDQQQEAELSRIISCATRMAVVSSSSISSSAVQLADTIASTSTSQEQQVEQQPPPQQSTTATATRLEGEAHENATVVAADVDAMTMSVTMKEVGHLMREQDADLLESHHARGANETNTPVLMLAPPPPAAAAAAMGGGSGAMTTTTTNFEIQGVLPLARQLSTDSSTRSIKGSIKGGVSSSITAATPTTPTIRKRITLHRSISRATSDGSGQQQHDASGISGNTTSCSTTQLQQQMMIEAQFAAQQLQQQPMSPVSHIHKRRPTLSGQVFEQQNDGTVSASSSVVAATVAASSSTVVPTTTTASVGSALLDVSSTLSIQGSAGDGDVLMDPGTINHCGVGGVNVDGGGSVAGLSLENMSINKPFGRTESMERRLNEMAQFAEAVGDVPSTVELRINDDEDDDDSTDAATTTVAATTVVTTTTTAATATSSAAAAATTTTAVETSNSQKRISIVVPITGSSSSRSLMRERINSTDHVVAPHHHHRVQNSKDFGVVAGGEITIPGIGGDPITTTTTAATMTTKPKIRPPWPFRSHRGFLDQLPDSNKQQDFTYKGIHANPPDIVKSGSQRGNYAQLHRKAWLEVSDKYHRYGKNLRLYYRYWERLGFPTNSFFDWLDSKGDAAGQPLPELEECQRSTLDADTVLYITNPDISQRYAVSFIPDPTTGRGRVVDVDGEIVVTGSDGWIFVLRDNVVYGAPKIASATPGHLSKQRFHHSSFFGGKAVAAAGIFITDDEGFLTRLYPHSGHYRPGEAHIQRMLFYMHQTGVDLRTFEMDMQQILHVARDKDKNKDNNTDAAGEKKKKIESLYLMPAVIVACYLAHKARFIGQGIFTQIHQIARTDATNVTEALELIDGDGICSSDMAPRLMDQG